jgi:hypothetical protein
MRIVLWKIQRSGQRFDVATRDRADVGASRLLRLRAS